MSTAQKIYKNLLKLDFYGHPIAVHYEGKTKYKTWLGLLCTMIVQGIFFETLLVLGNAFLDNSRQEEKAIVHKFDANESDTYYLADNGVNFNIFPYFQESEYDSDGNFTGYKFE